VDAPLAWVESPLQLVAAAELAAARDERIPVAMRLTGGQMTSTAEELLRRGARLAITPYFGVPWQQLAGRRHWAIGDAFSGQFRLAAALVGPRRLTLLDDGALSVGVADSLLGRRRYARPGTAEHAVQRALGELAMDRMLRLASREALEFATAFAFGDDRVAELAQRGASVRRHSFEWTRRTARPISIPGRRVLLGSALPVDGRMRAEAYLRWVGRVASSAPVAYLPHRREGAEQLAAVGATPGVRVHRTGLPVELVLAGAREPLEVITLPSSTRTTLRHVLAGSGSTIEVHPADSAELTALTLPGRWRA